MKSFFLSGDHATLALHASSFLPMHLETAGRSLLQHMLFHQYVSFERSTYQVTVGSGMGFQCSGEMASAATRWKEPVAAGGSPAARAGAPAYAARDAA